MSERVRRRRRRRSRRGRRILVREMNDLITCPLCRGYLIDATAFDCLHTFCRSCVLKHFDAGRQQTCPTCAKRKGAFRADHQLQALVYKLVPGLYAQEALRRLEFRRAAAADSEDSVLEADADGEAARRHQHQVYQQLGGPDDAVSLSLEFYQPHLDDTDAADARQRRLNTAAATARARDHQVRTSSPTTAPPPADRRYLQCPAAVAMTHLQKFVRMKYALTRDHRVDIIYSGEVLPPHCTLLDAACTFRWTQRKPMRFFYRIFTPLRVQPIRIVAAAQSNGSRQLQIVPVRPTPDLGPPTATTPTAASKTQFAAQLKLQAAQPQRAPSTSSPAAARPPGAAGDEHCVYVYEAPDEAEIQRFAESRDREWARMRHDEDAARKRKRPKHPAAPPPPPTAPPPAPPAAKKPKLHATEGIRLKVKLAPPDGAVSAPPSPLVRKLSEIVIRRAPSPKPPIPPPTSTTTTSSSSSSATALVAPSVGNRPQLQRKVHTYAPPKKVTFAADRPLILNSSSSSSSALKRRAAEPVPPALQITPLPAAPSGGAKAKRPPPATIPLERIRKGVGGVRTLNGVATVNGATPAPPRQPPPPPPATSLSNLQMLSKVALQHSQQVVNPTRPQMPPLKPVLPPGGRALPKLNEIGKPGKHAGALTRTIPNPSLLVRQHQQNRLLALNGHPRPHPQQQQQQQQQQPPPKILNILASEHTHPGGGGGKCKDERPPPKMMPIGAPLDGATERSC